MSPYKVDVPVLLIFFNRPSVLRKTFDQIKKARPSILFLYQDGVREGNKKDIFNATECRKIVSEIDWDCKVYKKYQDQNYGCDPSEYIAQKWAFEIVDKCIIIEDDDIASESFFRFCKELLDEYENDDRVCRISGLNHLGKYKNKDNSYFFTSTGSIWGWATWKRVVDKWDSTYSFLGDKNLLNELKKTCAEYKVNYKSFIQTCIKHKNSGREHYESIYYAYRLLNKTLTIVPTLNQISNVGLTEDSTHATSNMKRLPRGIKRVFMMDIYEINFPLHHPSEIINDLNYVKKVNRIMGYGFFRKLWRKVEAKMRSRIYN